MLQPLGETRVFCVICLSAEKFMNMATNQKQVHLDVWPPHRIRMKIKSYSIIYLSKLFFDMFFQPHREMVFNLYIFLPMSFYNNECFSRVIQFIVCNRPPTCLLSFLFICTCSIWHSLRLEGQDYTGTKSDFHNTIVVAKKSSQ